jgi:heme-degrading monooxygenase HmoA
MTAKMIAQMHVRDYEAFKSAFDGLRPVRQDYGASSHRLHRAVDDPNEIVVVSEWATADQARAFAQSTSLKEAQERAGVDAFASLVCEEVEAVTY